ncbi:hypothetical protein HRG_011345 [Hirsutella rhossiliensis]
MEDQFGGRTDDDLFYDDFEPVDNAPLVANENRQPHAPVPDVVPTASTAAGKAVERAPVVAPSPHQGPTMAPTSTPVQPSKRSLASSRFADKPAATTPVATATEPAINESTATDDSPGKHISPTASASPVDASVASSSGDHHHHHHKPPRASSQNTAASAEARLKSGANPRQKLSDNELADKMERMKRLAAEKTRKFQMAEKDERQHAEAYARGMEEARRRRAEDAERRRRADDDRRKLDDERARNHERKLKAMSIKEGGWDEGKEAAEQEARKGFRGANGGVRGSKSSGLSGSRFARDPADRPDVDRFLDERHSSRGRGGRGGRGGSNMSGREMAAAPPPNPGNAVPALTTDVFPALPTGPTSKKETDKAASKASGVFALSSPPAAGGKWDDEMELMDAVGKDT